MARVPWTECWPRTKPRNEGKLSIGQNKGGTGQGRAEWGGDSGMRGQKKSRKGSGFGSSSGCQILNPIPGLILQPEFMQTWTSNFTCIDLSRPVCTHKLTLRQEKECKGIFPYQNVPLLRGNLEDCLPQDVVWIILWAILVHLHHPGEGRIG